MGEVVGIRSGVAAKALRAPQEAPSVQPRVFEPKPHHYDADVIAIRQVEPSGKMVTVDKAEYDRDQEALARIKQEQLRRQPRRPK